MTSNRFSLNFKSNLRTIGCILLMMFPIAGQGRIPSSPSVGPLIASPSSLTAGSATKVKFTVKIAGATPLPGSVHLQQLHEDRDGNHDRSHEDTENGAFITLGVMHDDGRNGDDVPADGIYSLLITLKPSRAGSIYLRASVEFKERHSRVNSPVLKIPVSSTAFPVANAGGPYTGNVGQVLTFSGLQSTASSGQSITAYSWNFGDNSTGTGPTTNHTYNGPGTFQVSLTVTQTSGTTNTSTTTATISALPVSNAGGPYTGTTGQTLNF